MAEDKRQNPYPYPTAEEVDAAPGDRATKAARNIISRRIEGIPKRAYVMGDADNAPILKGIRDLTESVYNLLDAWRAGDEQAFMKYADTVQTMMEDHRCPSST